LIKEKQVVKMRTGWNCLWIGFVRFCYTLMYLWVMEMQKISWQGELSTAQETLFAMNWLHVWTVNNLHKDLNVGETSKWCFWWYWNPCLEHFNLYWYQTYSVDFRAIPS
jgi:hypothetical protein